MNSGSPLPATADCFVAAPRRFRAVPLSEHLQLNPHVHVFIHAVIPGEPMMRQFLPGATPTWSWISLEGVGLRTPSYEPDAVLIQRQPFEVDVVDVNTTEPFRLA